MASLPIPDVPLIQPSTDVGGLPPAPRLDPQEFAYSSTFGLRKAGEALGQVSAAAQEYVRVKRTLDEESDRQAAERAANVYKVNVAEAMTQVEKDLSVPPEQYAPKVEEASRKARESVGKTLTTARSRVLFEQRADNIMTSTTINARAEGLKLQLAGIKSGAAMERQALQRTAVYARKPDGTPDEAAQATAMAEIEAQITTFVRKGLYSGAEANAIRLDNAKTVAKGRVQVAWQDPVKRPELIRQLENGEIIGMDAEEQPALAQQLIRLQDQEDDRAYTKQERERKKATDAGVKDVTDLWYAGDTKGAQARLAEIHDQIPRDEYRQWMGWLQAPPPKPDMPNNDAVLGPLQVEVYSVDNNPRDILKKVHQAIADGHLNTPTHRILANELQNRILAEDQRAERRADRRDRQADQILQERKFNYTRGKDTLDETFRLTNQDAKTDDLIRSNYDAAIRDYYEHVSPYRPNSMTPEDWHARRMPIFRARLDSKFNDRAREITGVLTDKGIPITGDLRAPQTATNVGSYLKANQAALEQKHGVGGFKLIMQDVREAQIMANERVRFQESLRSQTGAAAPQTGVPGPGAPAKGTRAQDPALARPKTGGRSAN